MTIAELSSRRKDVGLRSHFVTADDVFHFDKNLILPSRQMMFGADFFTGNHVLEKVEETLPHFDRQSTLELLQFIERIVAFPQIQIPTIAKKGADKRRLELDEIIELHAQEVDNIKNQQLELAVYAGDNARLHAIDLMIRSSISLSSLHNVSGVSITLPATEYTPQTLIPLFNITTAAKLAFMTGLELPEALVNLDATSLNNDFVEHSERYF